jgi:hypothetical protein
MTFADRFRSALARSEGAVQRVLIGRALAFLVLFGAGVGVFALVVATTKQASPDWVIFSAPSHFEAGERSLIVGSEQGIPDDFVFTALGANAEILESTRLSPNAMSLRFVVAAGASGALLGAQSIERDAIVELIANAGRPPTELAAETSFVPESFDDEGKLVTPSRDFLYGAIPATVNGIAAIRIHNRRTGRWVRREIALETERERIALEEAILAAEQNGVFHPDPLEELVDTDGDGFPDVDEEPQLVPPVPEQIGVALEAGENILDVVVYDEVGNATWETIKVFANVDEVGETQD